MESISLASLRTDVPVQAGSPRKVRGRLSLQILGLIGVKAEK